MKKRIAFDLSSFIWTHLLVGKDTENGRTVKHEEKDVYINSAVYGYDNCMDRMINLLNDFKLVPINVILVVEGQNSKAPRLLIDQTYKGGGGSSRPPQMYEEFEKMRDMLKDTWRGLGAQILTQDAAEGDDVLGFLAHNTEDDLIIATFDNDLTVLNLHPNKHGARVSTWINQMFEHNKYMLCDYDLTTSYKALVGDASDNIKGCPGLGPAKFEKLIEKYGEDGLREIQNMLETSNLDPLAGYIGGKEDSLLQLILDNAPQVIRSFDLAKIRPEWVDTLRKPLQWEPGMVKPAPEGCDPRLKSWYGQSRLITADNFDQAIEWAIPHILASEELALDIETATPPESDEWIQRMGKDEDKVVDSFGSYLVGLGLTFGVNNQYTFYFSVRHADTNNIDSEKLREFIAAIPRSKPLVIQNVSFELTVLFNEWGARQMDNGFEGFLPNVLDTALEASYVDENTGRGLKERSLAMLGYRQQTFDETVELTGHPSTLPKGGKVRREKYETAMVGTGKFEKVLIVDDAGQPILNAKGKEQYAKGAEILREEIVYQFKPGCTEQTPDTAEEDDPNLEPVVLEQTRRYKMDELPATHVVGYGSDDPICTIALHNYYKLFMQLEHTWKVYLAVEIGAAYQHAKNFIDGCDCSLEKLNTLAAEDDKVFDKSWATLRNFLIDQGWEGVHPPVYTDEITAAQVKEAFEIVTGRPMDTQMRTIDKLAKFAMAQDGGRIFGELLLDVCGAPEGAATNAALEAFNAYVQSHFKGEPLFNDGSPKQMQRLMYEVLGLPVRVRNKPTDLMRSKGIHEGTPKTDSLAIAYALLDCDSNIEMYNKLSQAFSQYTPEECLEKAAQWGRTKEVLEALKLMAMVGTRRSLYYSQYPGFPHWKDGKIRSSHNQSATNTRRASMAKPNLQQLPKHQKIEGYASRFRETIVPHRPDAVILSIDFKAQELRVIAHLSQDPIMLSMYIGDNLRDQHTLTGLAIAQRRDADGMWTYDSFSAVLKDENHLRFKFVKECRNLGKKLNFTAEYGAMSEKVAQTLLISVEDAQAYLDAREAMFARVAEYKERCIAEVKRTGKSYTLLGAVRHLGPALTSGDKWIASKAERQGFNYEVQGSCAEQTKLAEGRVWDRRLVYKYDAVCIGPIHDELVFSVAIKDLFEFVPAVHACMVEQYADMSVPIEGDISFGPNFFQQIEIGAVPSREAIQKGLEKLKELQGVKEAA